MNHELIVSERFLYNPIKVSLIQFHQETAMNKERQGKVNFTASKYLKIIDIQYVTYLMLYNL